MQETKIPQHLMELLTSPTLYEGVIKVGEGFNLHIDQIDELTSEIKLYLLGRTSAANFLPNIVERLEIEEAEAKKIIERINLDIIEPLKKQMVSSAPTQHIETPDEILKHIEDGGLELPAPEPMVEPPKPIEQAVAPAPKTEAPTVESTDLTDHLLKNPVASPHIEENVEKKYTVDPYREPIN